MLFHRAINLCDFARSNVRTASITCKTCCPSLRDRVISVRDLTRPWEKLFYRGSYVHKKQHLLRTLGAANSLSPCIPRHAVGPLFSRHSVYLARAESEVAAFEAHTIVKSEDRFRTTPPEGKTQEVHQHLRIRSNGIGGRVPCGGVTRAQS
jgi:hypothetical protein